MLQLVICYFSRSWQTGLNPCQDSLQQPATLKVIASANQLYLVQQKVLQWALLFTMQAITLSSADLLQTTACALEYPLPQPAEMHTFHAYLSVTMPC